MTVNSLAALFDQLQALPFPDHPESDSLADWILELAEVDGYFAGLAQSVIAGQSPGSIEVGELASFGASLERIEVTSPLDARILQHCRQYLDLLDRVRSALLELGCRRKRT